IRALPGSQVDGRIGDDGIERTAAQVDVGIYGGPGEIRLDRVHGGGAGGGIAHPGANRKVVGSNGWIIGIQTNHIPGDGCNRKTGSSTNIELRLGKVEKQSSQGRENRQQVDYLACEWITVKQAISPSLCANKKK